MQNFESATGSIVIHWKTCSRGVPVLMRMNDRSLLRSRNVFAQYSEDKEKLAHTITRGNYRWCVPVRVVHEWAVDEGGTKEGNGHL